MHYLKPDVVPVENQLPLLHRGPSVLALRVRQDIKCLADLGHGSIPDCGWDRFKRREVPPLHVLLLEVQS
jgi:hypothetical protein